MGLDVNVGVHPYHDNRHNLGFFLMADLSARYEFRPEGPILIEVFPRHDDFAVRTLGLPGMIGALGACTMSVMWGGAWSSPWRGRGSSWITRMRG